MISSVEDISLLSYGNAASVEDKIIPNQLYPLKRSGEYLICNIHGRNPDPISKSEVGSLYFSVSPGFALYREKTGLLQDEVFVENLNKGFGAGVLSTFGYSYVLHDRISLDLGLNLSLYWIDVDQELTPAGTSESVNFSISNLSFSFGFKVLLDSLHF